MTKQMDFLLQIIIGLGVIICIAEVYVAVNMLVTESRGNIAMLKVLGYRDKQIDKIILRSHHILLPIGILLSIPCVYAAAHAFFLLMIDYGVMLIDKVWVGRDKFWELPGTEDIPFVQTWKQVLEKCCILALIWVAGAAFSAGLVVLIL